MDLILAIIVALPIFLLCVSLGKAAEIATLRLLDLAQVGVGAAKVRHQTSPLSPPSPPPSDPPEADPGPPPPRSLGGGRRRGG